MSARHGQHQRILCALLGSLSLLVLDFFAPVLNFAPVSNSGSGAALAEPLRASITQYDVAKGWIPSERLPLADWEKKVARRLKSGLAWSDKLLPAQGDDVRWVQIPVWLAGHWRIERARFILDKTGMAAPDAMNVEDDVFGFQQDKNGGYWENAAQSDH